MDTLSFWGYTRDDEALELDFGKAPRRSSDDVQFRVKNESTAYTATDVTVTIDGTLGWYFYLSVDGEDFTGSLALGDLAPEALSDVIWLRRVIPADAAVGTLTVDLVATAATWAVTDL